MASSCGAGAAAIAAPDAAPPAAPDAAPPAPPAGPAPPAWHHISQRFGDIPWHAGWQEGAGAAPAGAAPWAADSRILHYHGRRKAWEMRPDEWPDVAAWWRFAAAAVAADPAAAAAFDAEALRAVARDG